MKRRNIDTMREVGSAVSAKTTELKQKIDKKIKKRRSPINGALSFIFLKGDLI